MAAQEHGHTASEYPRPGQRLHKCSGLSLPVLGHTKKAFPDLQREAPMFQFVGTHKNSLAYLVSVPLLQLLIYVGKDPLQSLLQAEQPGGSSLSPSLLGAALVPSLFLWTFAGGSPV